MSRQGSGSWGQNLAEQLTQTLADAKPGIDSTQFRAPQPPCPAPAWPHCSWDTWGPANLTWPHPLRGVAGLPGPCAQAHSKVRGPARAQSGWPCTLLTHLAIPHLEELLVHGDVRVPELQQRHQLRGKAQCGRLEHARPGQRSPRLQPVGTALCYAWGPAPQPFHAPGVA